MADSLPTISLTTNAKIDIKINDVDSHFHVKWDNASHREKELRRMLSNLHLNSSLPVQLRAITAKWTLWEAISQFIDSKNVCTQLLYQDRSQVSDDGIS